MTRCLSLDGGGVFGLIEARTLARLHPDLSGHAILAQYDLVIGTSAGAIVLAGLIADMTPDAIANLFLDAKARRTLFVPLPGFDGLIGSSGVGPKWSSAGKLAGLTGALGASAEMPLGHAPGRVAIVAFDVDRQREVILTSYGYGADVPLALAAHASSSAPVLYFDAPAIVALRGSGVSGTGALPSRGSGAAPERGKEANKVAECDANPASDQFGASPSPGKTGGASVCRRDGAAALDQLRLWDGGVAGLGNPSSAGCTEAFWCGLRDLTVLSLGTGTVWRPVGTPPSSDVWPLWQQPRGLGEVDAIKAMAGSVLDDPPSKATDDAYATTLGKTVRMSPVIIPDRTPTGWVLSAVYDKLDWPKGGMDAFRTLVAMDMDETNQDRIELLDRWCNAWLDGAVPNEPIRVGADGECLVGQATFSGAVGEWSVVTTS